MCLAPSCNRPLVEVVRVAKKPAPPLRNVLTPTGVLLIPLESAPPAPLTSGEADVRTRVGGAGIRWVASSG
eukprot:4254822-Alexandrium_andersonii.AAC.1